MKGRFGISLAAVFFCLASTASVAALQPYSQDFEALDPADPGALANDGWLVFGNVFAPDWTYLYGYGPFGAPNGGPGFSGVAVGEGGPEQGTQQLSVYSDYNNGDHALGRWIEANVFQEQTIGAMDVGSTWLFKFDAKRGNIEGATSAKAFIKTLDPANGFQLTNFIWIDTTNVTSTWESFGLSIAIDPTLEGQILQFGFLNTATLYEGSGVFYDNVDFLLGVDLDVKPGSCPNPIQERSRGLLPVALLGDMGFDVAMVDVDSLRLEGQAPVMSRFDDVAAPFGGELCGCNTEGPDGYVDLSLKFQTDEILAAIGPDAVGDTVVTLTGTLLDGTPIEGQDCVVILDNPGGGRPQSGALDTSGTSSGTTGMQPSDSVSSFSQR